MLNISSKSRYGIAALLYLAEFYNSGLLTMKDIALHCDIPHEFLKQIFNQLGKAGIIKSMRGKKGGYELAMAPDQVTVLQIVNILEGEIDFVPNFSNDNDVISELFKEAEGGLREILSIDLGELILKKQSLQKSYIYSI